VAALRSGWLPVTTLGPSLTGRRPGLDVALGQAPREQVAGSLYVIFAAGVLLLPAFADRARNFWLAVPVDGGQRR
jgi:hypothetical protein